MAGEMKGSTYKCKGCGKEISEKANICPHCGADISKNGRDILLSLSDSIKLSDEAFVKIIGQADVKWEANDLALIGILLTLAIGCIPLLNILFNNLWLSIILAFIGTCVLMILITKVRFIKRSIIKFLRWLLK